MMVFIYSHSQFQCLGRDLRYVYLGMVASTASFLSVMMIKPSRYFFRQQCRIGLAPAANPVKKLHSNRRAFNH